MSQKSGWYQNEDRTYYMDEHGRPIVVKPKSFHYNSPGMDIPTYPEVASGKYRSSFGAPSSYPPRSQPGPATSRFSDRNMPRFGSGSEHSARGHVDHPASKPSVSGFSRPGISTDVYRDMKAQFAAAGPSNSPYDKDHHAYKALGDADATTGQRYNDWKRTTYVPPTTEEMRNHPEALGGKPLQTQGWHREGSRRASEAARAAQAHGDAREAYKANYVGYHQRHYYSGHQMAIDSARRRERGFMDKVKSHDNWDTLQDRLDAGRRKAESRRG
ncbi:hypothetical protein GGR58DRAFT_323879 [Xylaria digitata]|nr:hypothetical protein GGR58DRAFT_323879 [Xylaria digitata]